MKLKCYYHIEIIPKYKDSRNMRAVLIICQWEEDKLKNLIPGVSDIYFCFFLGKIEIVLKYSR